MCSKEELTYIYHIAKTRPKVENFEVTPELSPETVPSDPTSNQSEKQVPEKNLG